MANSSQSTQNFIPLKDVKDGIIVLKDGSLRAALMVSSVNFALKSEDERKSIIFQFQNLLNSLDFSIQINVQSRRLDIEPYIATLEERERQQVNDLMKIQTREYIDFIRNFTENTNIMTKTFFVIVPYSPAFLQSKEGVVKKMKSFIPWTKKDEEAKKQRAEEMFEENRTQLEQRISIVEQGLSSSGLRVARLGTEEVTELFYKTFNPGETGAPLQTDIQER